MSLSNDRPLDGCTLVFWKRKPRENRRGYYQHYWLYPDGGEGGELALDYLEREVADYDGAFDLPRAVKDELNAAGWRTPWD